MASKEAAYSTRTTPIELPTDYNQTVLSSTSATSRPTHDLDHSAPEVVQYTAGDGNLTNASAARAAHDYSIDHKLTWREKFTFFRTKDFWLILLLGQVLALCITGTNTLTTLLVVEGTSIPAFQTLFNYVLLCFIYTPWTIYKYGFKKYARMLWKDGWKCKSHNERTRNMART